MKPIFLLILASTCALAGCASPHPSFGNAATVSDRFQPPPPRQEVIAAAPESYDFWVAGFWRLEGGEFVWQPGRWIEPRAGEDYVQAHWARHDGEWQFHPARWQSVRTSPGVAVVAAPSPPPQPRIEAITPPPGLEFIYIAGHYRLVDGQYAWIPGRWEHDRPGEHWLSAHWAQQGPSWSYVPGRWESE